MKFPRATAAVDFLEASDCRQRRLPSKVQFSSAERHRPAAGGGRRSARLAGAVCCGRMANRAEASGGASERSERCGLPRGGRRRARDLRSWFVAEKRVLAPCNPKGYRPCRPAAKPLWGVGDRPKEAKQVVTARAPEARLLSPDKRVAACKERNPRVPEGRGWLRDAACFGVKRAGARGAYPSKLQFSRAAHPRLARVNFDRGLLRESGDRTEVIGVVVTLN